MKLTTIVARGATALVLTALTTVAAAGTVQADQDDNWHVHDGSDAPVPPGFADVLGGDGDGVLTTDEHWAYLQDPLRCPDATDKGLLPNGRHGEQPFRTGVCFTDAYIVHLRTVTSDTAVPPSWSELLNRETVGGVRWKTLYLLTPLP